MLASLSKIHEIVMKEPKETALGKIKGILAAPEDKQKQRNSKKLPVSIGASGKGSYSIFGPTSAFHNVVDMSEENADNETPQPALLNLSLLMECLSNFFKWQYPDIATFIHRESFLNDFLYPKSNRGYCSEELVYAIAAVGAKCSDDDMTRSLAPSFFETSKRMLFLSKIFQPQICTLQALLCLSLYELGEGNASASWMLSGMAIRMGYDLGFQLNPKDWAISDPTTNEQELIVMMDVTVRSRIYWGCYIFDNFVSLVMGRPVTVRKSEALIPSSEHLPNSENIDDFVFQPSSGPHSVANVDPSATISHLCSLSECAGSLLSEIFSMEAEEEGMAYMTRQKVIEHNQFLSSWRRGLPSAMKWTKASLKRQTYNPTLMNFRLFYYVVLICLNRPFITDPDSQSFCDNAIDELAICLDKFNEGCFPPSVLVVYTSLLVMTVVLLKIFAAKSEAEVLEADLKALSVFHVTVSRSCSYWKLATKFLLFMKKKVDEMGFARVSRIFGSGNELEGSLTQSEVDQILSSNEFFNVDQLLSNFFEFSNFDEWSK